MSIYKSLVLISLITIVAVIPAKAQEYKMVNSGNDFSITTSLNFISSASIQNNPNSPSLIERNTFDEVSGGYGYGLSIRKKLFSDITLSVSTEYIRIVDNEQVQLLQNGEEFVKATATETLWMIPLEVSASFILPRISENFIVYLGGGVGVYFGDRKREFLGISTETISKQSVLNLHIISGVEYFFSRHFSSVLELRFREGQYKVNSAFPSDNIVVNNSRYTFQKDLNSKIFMDGLRLGLGISYYFN